MELNNETIRSLADEGERLDGRQPHEYREIELETGYINKTAEGSAYVSIGDTQLVVGLKVDVEDPYDDRPDAGTLVTNAELAPMAAREYESGPPQEPGVELARVVDRGIREAPAVDFEELCIEEGEKVYTLFIDVHVLNDDGNLLDAAALGAMASLKDGFLPEYDEEEGLLREQPEEGSEIPMNSIPITATGRRIGDNLLFDTTSREEEALGARLTVAFTEDGNIVAMQKGGDDSMEISDITEAVEIAEQKSEMLREVLEQ